MWQNAIAALVSCGQTGPFRLGNVVSMERISVVGCSGSGKTTMAGALSARLGIPYLELDGVFHQPDWTPLPEDEFRSEVGTFTSHDRWVVDGNYNMAGVLDLVWERADTVVWLDPPRHTVMRQVVVRTVSRGVRRKELWNGNREDLRNLTKWDPDENIVRWAWTRFESTRSRYESRSTDPRWGHLSFVRLPSNSAAGVFLDTLER